MKGELKVKQFDRQVRGDAKLIKRVSDSKAGGFLYAWGLNCSKCNYKIERSAPPNAPLEFVAQRFRTAGWQIDNDCRDPVCPNCQKPAEKKVMAPVSLISRNNMKSQRQLHELLAEHFDAEHGRYTEGWDDHKVATETGLAEIYVMNVRNEAYGTIRTGPPPELVDLQLDFSSFVLNAEKELQTTAELVEGTRTSLDQQINAFRGRLNALFERFK